VTRTIPHLFDAAVADAPDKAWLRFEDETYTFAQARERIGRAAGALAAAGVGKGDLVLTAPRNVPEHLFTWFAVGYLGAIVVTANPKSSEAELAGLAGQVQPRAVVTDDEVPAMAGLAGDISVPLGDLFANSATVDDAGPAGEDDAVVLIPTSGTTGRSKLVTQTHRAYVMAGEGFPWWMELTSDDRLMTSLPLFHINAPAYTTLGSVAARAGLVLLPRFSASRFIDDARRHGATEFNAIGAMLEILMRQPERPDDADNPLRLAYAGPAPPKQRHLEIEERFGLRIVSGYAMSETPYGTIWARGTRPYGTLGSIRQHPELGVVNEGRVVEGELQLRNPAVMRGYWGMPEETDKVLLPDGWLRTGDLVEQNLDGTYTFLGRLKEVIRRRGENVAPAEIEEALADHRDVLEVAVVGVPSELSEEEIKAFVLVSDPAEADLAAIRGHAAAQLAPFKVPRYLEAVAELPHTPTGRIAKHQLTRERTDGEIDFDTARTGGR
jgi:crotonobetaine/carnitine-CoA ligase